jgi:hypothetical protein
VVPGSGRRDGAIWAGAAVVHHRAGVLDMARRLRSGLGESCLLQANDDEHIQAVRLAMYELNGRIVDRTTNQELEIP